MQFSSMQRYALALFCLLPAIFALDFAILEGRQDTGGTASVTSGSATSTTTSSSSKTSSSDAAATAPVIGGSGGGSGDAGAGTSGGNTGAANGLDASEGIAFAGMLAAGAAIAIL